MGKLHVFFVINGWDGDLALGHEVIIVDVIRQQTRCCRRHNFMSMDEDKSEENCWVLSKRMNGKGKDYSRLISGIWSHINW